MAEFRPDLAPPAHPIPEKPYEDLPYADWDKRFQQLGLMMLQASGPLAQNYQPGQRQSNMVEDRRFWTEQIPYTIPGQPGQSKSTLQEFNYTNLKALLDAFGLRGDQFNGG